MLLLLIAGTFRPSICVFCGLAASAVSVAPEVTASVVVKVAVAFIPPVIAVAWFPVVVAVVGIASSVVVAVVLVVVAFRTLVSATVSVSLKRAVGWHFA